MAYTILNTDGTILLILPDNQLDKSSTSLSLIGKNFAAYGQELNNNFVRLLANFASTSGNPPRSPLLGQLWYDTTVKRLKVYDNGFKTIGAVTIASSQPTSLQTGDLWFDSANQQLKIYSAGIIYSVGPSFPFTIGSTGLVLPSTPIKDTNGTEKNTVLLRSYGTTIGVVYYDNTGQKSPFSMNINDLDTFVPNATTSTVVSGVTLVGDLSVSGKITNNYLSTAVDLDVVSLYPDALSFRGPTTSTYGTGATDYQNPAIAAILNKMFPPVVTTATSTSTAMSGVLLGTQARVLCRYSLIGGAVQNGYQVRVFRTVGTHSASSWQPYYYTTGVVGGSFDTPINYIS